MGSPAPKMVNLVVFGALFGLGVALCAVFVLPRWWVLTGDIPSSLATTGRIAAGIPFGLAAIPVLRLLQSGLRSKPRSPELALRLLAWSAILLVTAGVLILLAAIAEFWLSLEVGGPWLSAVYGAAGAVAMLGLLALWLSSVITKPPKPPKPAKPVKPAAAEASKAKKPTTKRGRATRRETTESEEPAEAEVSDADADGTPDAEPDADGTPDAEPDADEPVEAALRNKRPSSKSQRQSRG